MLPRKTEAVIIGGGVIGSSIAYYLAKKRIKIILLEKDGIASGTSSACEGLVFLQSKKPGVHLKLALESSKKFSNLKEELNYDIEYRNNGGMVIIENNEELKAMKIFVEEQRNIGLDVSLLDRDRAKEKEPALSQDILGSTYSPLDAQVNPMYLSFAFISSARNLGAEIYTHTEVTGIRLKSNRINSIETTIGEIKTDIVINAAGIYAPEIGRMVSLDIPIKPRRGQLLVTESVPRILNGVLISAKYIAAKFNPSLAETEGEGISIEQTVSGNILIGSTREFVDFNKNITPEGINSIAKHIIILFPQLKEINIIRTFAGLRPYTPDGLPILGKVEEIEGFIMAAGHEGDGIALSPITGDLIAELVVDGKTTIPLNEFRLERFYS
ncbi:FAD-binding oxidoreductase [Candidatus Atribacteria bacterium HGW-Atribacteria-1]|nr:MAG: FAD-binding oxidoreductase [Candidatus Atribacteria bacterium HGW-Atribacteria-1]